MYAPSNLSTVRICYLQYDHENTIRYVHTVKPVYYRVETKPVYYRVETKPVYYRVETKPVYYRVETKQKCP